MSGRFPSPEWTLLWLLNVHYYRYKDRYIAEMYRKVEVLQVEYELLAEDFCTRASYYDRGCFTRPQTDALTCIYAKKVSLWAAIYELENYKWWMTFLKCPITA